jgi:hypothetical protein
VQIFRDSHWTAIESQATGNLKPWREVVNPHKDVASGRYQQAELAADLWQTTWAKAATNTKNLRSFSAALISRKV